jgi:hypothetical protein
LVRKLSTGVHTVRIKTGKGNKTRLQKVRVNAKGQWKFLKMGRKSPTKRKGRKRPTSYKRKNNPSKKVRKTAKGKFFKNLSLVGFAEDLAWGYAGMTVLGADASSLATTRVIQGIQGHVLGRRGKGRLIYAIADLIDLWLIGQFKLPIPQLTSFSRVRNL